MDKLKSSLRTFYGRHPDMLYRYRISESQMITNIFHLSQTLPGPFFIHDLSSGFVTRLTRRKPPLEQELFTLPEHPSSPPVFSEVSVTRSLVLCVCLVARYLSFCTLLLAIVLSVLLRFTDSYYPFGIFKLFLQIR